MTSELLRWLKPLTSLKLTICCLACAMVLVFLGTLDQVHIGVYEADDVRSFRVLEALDERPALADGRGKIQPAHLGKILRHRLNDAQRVIAAAIEDNDEPDFARIIFFEEIRVVTQHRFDARLFIISRY